MMRDGHLFRAVLRRISDQGDMHIRISTRTLARIERACGFHWDADQDAFREIDARALEALVSIALQRISV